MEYMKEFGIKNEQIIELKERYNNGIIKFLTLTKLLAYLKKNNDKTIGTIPKAS